MVVWGTFLMGGWIDDPSDPKNEHSIMELLKVNKNHRVLGHFFFVGWWDRRSVGPKNEHSILELLKVNKNQSVLVHFFG